MAPTLAHPPPGGDGTAASAGEPAWSTRAVPGKERKIIAADLRAICAAPTAEAAEPALEAFARKWDGRFPTISKSWQANRQRVIPFFAYPPEIRKVIYTTNAIESINASLREVTRKRGAFPNPDSVRKVPYLSVRKASARWARPIKDWVAALNHFTMVFEGRVPNR